tara:strand:+ start:522 stop:740 length:219 start_codon:yes stop_codon:yes gene_type:complete
MSDENKDQEDGVSKSLLKFWSGIDIQIRRMLIGGLVLIMLYYLMSPLQQCKRQKSTGPYPVSDYWCYKNINW